MTHKYEAEVKGVPFELGAYPWMVAWTDAEGDRSWDQFYTREAAEHFAAQLNADVAGLQADARRWEDAAADAALKIRELQADIERLTAELDQSEARVDDLIAAATGAALDRDAARSEVERLTAVAAEMRKRFTADIERLTAERDAWEKRYDTVWGNWRLSIGADPEAPPITCVEVDRTEQDGEMVRTWRAMGEDVRTLGGEWERKIMDGQLARYGPYPWDAPKAGDDASQHGRAFPDCCYLVRRVAPPAPRTERVPWWEAKGRKTPSGFVVTDVEWRNYQDRPFFYAKQGWMRATTDGTVEVLVEDGTR